MTRFPNQLPAIPPPVPTVSARDRIVDLTFPEKGALRARRVVSRSRTRPTYKYPSFKAGRMVQCESENELNAYRILDVNPFVLAFNEQPCKIRYVLDGEEHSHYPDTLVALPNAKELWEIKPLVEARDPTTIRRTSFLVRDLPRYGYDYRLVIAEDVRRQPRLNNALTILRFGRPSLPELARERIRRVFAELGSITWGAVLSGAFGPLGRNHICRLILEGVLSFDIEQPLQSETLISSLARHSDTWALEN